MMAGDFTPGYPIDLRAPERRMHLAQGPVGDFEYMAARVVARLTGERVVIQDDGQKPGMPDIRIEYAAKLPGYIEVVVDIDPTYAAMAAQVFKPINRLPADMMWKLHITGQANLKRLRRKLPEILGPLQHPPTPDMEQRLASMGVTAYGPWPPGPDRPAGIYMAPEGIIGSAARGWGPLLEWIRSFLESTRAADVRKKLAATGAAERHVFIGASHTTPGDAYFALHREGRAALPSTDPILPPEITHLWVWAVPGHPRCLAWFPDRGWLDPIYHWATP